jgi:hypothetical protein
MSADVGRRRYFELQPKIRAYSHNDYPMASLRYSVVLKPVQMRGKSVTLSGALEISKNPFKRSSRVCTSQTRHVFCHKPKRFVAFQHFYTITVQRTILPIQSFLLSDNTVITHWKGSMHKDHEATYYIVQDAIFYAALPAIKRELPAHGCYTQFFAENWEDPYGFEVDTYVDITDSFDQWLRAVSEYELFSGSISDFRYLDYYKALAVMRGCLARKKYAVGLMRPKGAKVHKGDALPGKPL